MMPDNTELQQLVDSESQNLPAGIPPDRIAVSWPIGAYTSSDGFVTIHSILRGKRCGARQVLDVTGYGITGNNGTVRISLNGFHCLNRPPEAGTGAFEYDDPINVIATARGSTPVFLTVTTEVVPRASSAQNVEDVLITVFGWAAGGNPQSGVVFNWRCRVLTSSSLG
jgi:hypothetical protein